MKVNCITRTDINNSSKTFRAHPDFYRLKEDFEILASCYFRRGKNYGAPSASFTDVINSLKSILLDKRKKSMLIVGIGESQEPFSLLAVIKDLIGNESLQDKIDLHTVDLQSKPSKNKLFQQSFYDSFEIPKYAKESFITDRITHYRNFDYITSRVKDEIFDFLHDTYNNPKKSQWNTRIQDIAANMPNESYDIISVNNTLGYINNEHKIINTIDNIIRMLKKKGIFITDPISEFNIFCKNKTLEIYNGIFKKY